MLRAAREGEAGRAFVGVDKARFEAVVGCGLYDARRQRLGVVLGMDVPFRVRLRRRPMDGERARVSLRAHRAAEAPLKEEGTSFRRARKEEDGGNALVLVGLVAVLAAEKVEPSDVELFVEREIGHRLQDEFARHVPGEEGVEGRHLVVSLL